MTIICFISYFKDRVRALIITNMIVLWGPIEFISCISLTAFCALYSSFNFSGTSGFAFVAYLILNVSSAIAFEIQIARKYIEYMNWRNMYPKTSKCIIVLSGLFSFKILRLHYSLLFGYDCFKAQFQFPGVFQRQIIIFTIVHLIFVNCIILGVDIVGFVTLKYGTQIYTTMIETALMFFILMILDFIELCKLKSYLGDDE